MFDDDIIDLTGDNPPTSDLLRSGERILGQLRLRGQVFKPGDFVEVANCSLGLYPVDFLQVTVAVGHYNGDVILRGIPFSRTRNLLGKLPKKLDEICKLLHIERSRSSPQSPNESPVLFDVHHYNIVRKRNLIFTNAAYPEYCSSRIAQSSTRGDPRRSRRRREYSAVLVCRWAMKVYFVRQGRQSKPEEEVLERLLPEDAPDIRYRVSDETLCNRWRGCRIKGGSWDEKQPYSGSSAVVNLEDESSGALHTHCAGRGSRRYTLFDAFSGAGGVSRGAQTAGFKVLYAVDSAPEVWDTYQRNFPETVLYGMPVDEFIQSTQKEPIRVDVLHLSPPCQYFSPAHTHDSVHDDDNIFALFGCNQLINKTRPRLITVEQTFGITHNRHRIYLRSLIGDFTQFGYSVRWKIVRLCTWGSAQDRKRLVVIAAAPGERLPPFPQPTHSETGGEGLVPFTTIRQAIRGLRNTDSLHDIHSVKHYDPPRPQVPNGRLAGTITTGSADLYHPNGERDLTLREYACIQGFPRHHHFLGNKTSIRRQIGNAFPPNTVVVLYQHLQKWLLREDGLPSHRNPRDNAILITDEDERDITSNPAPIPFLDAGPLRPDADNAMEVDEDVVELTRDEFDWRRRVIDLTI
ncbi:cytosine methyltransferase [Purpureocillium lavendulum]|uniref:DNA (cytosine-5-)-methyltransferase n=1 Tax=Purpureocillium lavendulum TaxID=1247861 RepID=A0AB34FXP3_9HYPO|nr:cytosine methyltransferase [Purpureocillium lavendulum]